MAHADRPEVPHGAAAIPAAIGDVVTDTARDVTNLPQAPAQAAAFQAKRLLLPLGLAHFLNTYDTSSMNVAISNIVSDLNTTVTGVQAAISIYSLVMAAGMIVGSKLTDIWGRKPTFIAGVVTFGTGALITSLSPSIGVMLFGWSLLEGIGSVLMIPPIYILIAVNFNDVKARTAAFGFISAMAGLGSASSPIFAGFITTLATWRVSFALEVVAVLVIIYLSRGIVDEAREGPKPKLDIKGAILSAVGMIALVVGALMASAYGWIIARQAFVIAGYTIIPEGGISPVWIFIGIGVLTLLAFGAYMRYREKSDKEPLVHTRVLFNRMTMLSLIAQSSHWFLLLGGIFVVSLFLQIAFEYNAIQTGLSLIPASIGLLFFSRRAGQLADKYSQRGIMQAGFLTFLAGVITLLLMVDADGSAWQFVPGLLLLGSGIGLVMPAAANAVQSSASEEDQGEVTGLSRSASNLGSSLGTALAGAVLIAILISGVTRLTAESTVLPPQAKEEIAAALENNVSAVSDTQLRQTLQGRPEPVVDEVVRINAAARNRALGAALLAIGVVGMIGLVATFFLPGGARARQSPEGAP